MPKVEVKDDDHPINYTKETGFQILVTILALDGLEAIMFNNYVDVNYCQERKPWQNLPEFPWSVDYKIKFIKNCFNEILKILKFGNYE